MELLLSSQYHTMSLNVLHITDTETTRCHSLHVKPCPHCRRKLRLYCRRKVRLSPNSASLTFLRQSHFSATVWTGLNASCHLNDDVNVQIAAIYYSLTQLSFITPIEEAHKNTYMSVSNNETKCRKTHTTANNSTFDTDNRDYTCSI